MRTFLRSHAPLFVFAFLIIVSAIAWRIALARSPFLTVYALNVGQGDAILITLPDGNDILIDGGPDATVLSELSSVLPPNDRTIEIVVATHPEADHVSGLLDVLARYDVAMVVESGIRKDTALSRAWEEAVAREGAEVLFIDRPKRLRFGDLATLDLLWPAESHVGQIMEKPNNESVVARLTYGETSFLFTGDIEEGTEEKLLSSGFPLDVDVLKVAHHGSATSTQEAFLDAVSPKLALISVGAENRYGHPAPIVLDRLARRGISVYRTDREGRIAVVSNGRTLEVLPQLRTR
jgi:competence protein ComEC